MRYRVDPTWWRHTHETGDTVVAGSPVRVLRFTSSATRFLENIESGRDLDPSTNALQQRLVSAGAIHPIFSVDDAPKPDFSMVTVVIPARVTDQTELLGLVQTLPDAADIVIVDDGSPIPIRDVDRARIVRNEWSLGPAGARNRALDSVRTQYVLFLDHDIVLPRAAIDSAFWSPLMLHLHDEAVVAVAPRVRSTPGHTRLERYEVEHSPLDMGTEPALVRPGSRVPYVPSAALLVRTSVLRSLQGFDEDLRYGEDVDFVWRATEAGLVCRYEPAVEIGHRPRATWRELLEQRFHYGTAAADLEGRHPGTTRPLRIDRTTATTIALVAIGHPFTAVLVAVGSAARLTRRLSSIPDRWYVALRLVARGQFFAVRAVLETAMRTWWPLTCLMCMVSKRARAVIAAHVVARTLRDRLGAEDSPHAAPLLDPVLCAMAKMAEDAAYGSGVLYAAMRRRAFDSLLARLD